MAAQHRRGGKHAVKDADLTHTKYDDYNREQLLAAVKEAGCYVKDDKKSTMARKLVEHDRNKETESRRAAQERRAEEEARRQELNSAAQAQRGRRTARAKRNEQRGTRRELGEEASSNSDDTDEEQNRGEAHRLTVTGGEALSDETWEDTCSETTVSSENPPPQPGRRLQLFEWPYLHSPQDLPLDLDLDQHPAPLIYAPLRLLTTNTQEKITLPGKTYPTGIEPDFVPILDPLTRSATRHGHMINQLAHALVEPASCWVTRTIVQGWNGCIYFNLAPQHDAKNVRLDAVYRKWHLQNAKLLQPTPGSNDVKGDRRLRFEQRTANKRKMIAEMYEASLWKPSVLGYMPAHLDWEAGARSTGDEDGEKSLSNLWYVRFPGCDVPHYYFWGRPGEWSDVTTPDPSWSANGFEKCTNTQPTKIRIKKLTAAPTDNASQRAGNVLSSYEHDLRTYGLSATLAKNRRLAHSAGRQREWRAFTRRLPCLYPSGALPGAPPAHAEKGTCLADKIGLLLSGDIVTPYTGQEAWTRNDDSLWDVVTLYHDAVSDSDSTLLDAYNTHTGDGGQALYRKDSIHTPLSPLIRIRTWLSSIECTESGTAPSPLPYIPTTSFTAATTKTCPFCSTPWTLLPDPEKAAHLLSHSHVPVYPLVTPLFTNVRGVCAKRRCSMLSQRTLESYHNRNRAGAFQRGRKVARLVGDLRMGLEDGVDDVVDGACVGGGRRERSPFSKEVRRCKGAGRWEGEGRGGKGWMLERRQSLCDSEEEYEMAAGEGESGSEGWEGDNELEL